MHKKVEKHLKKNKILEHSYRNAKHYKNVYKHCLGLDNENILIIGDHGFKNRNLSSMLTHMNYVASQDEGFDAKVIFQKPKNRVTEVDKPVLDALKNLPKNSVIFTNISHRLGTLDGLGKSFRKFCKQRGHRFISSTSLGAIHNNNHRSFMRALDVDYKKLSKRHWKLKKKLDNASEAHITTKAGTDMFFDLQGMDGRVADSIYREPGTGGNLPAGEAYIAPANKGVFGKAVIDVSAKTMNGTVMVNQPISMYIENGDVKKIKGGYEARKLQKSIDWAHKTANTTWGLKRIGELGIGLNDRARPIGATLIDEKVLGTAHIAIGSNYWFGGSVRAKIHLDQVFNKPTIKLDGKKIAY